MNIKDINRTCKKNVKSTLKILKSNLIELSNKSGLQNIFDGIKLVINEIDKRFLDNMDYESKIYYTSKKYLF